MKKLYYFILFITFGLWNSCAPNRQPPLPEILTAEYEIKTHSESERGYEVFLVIDGFPETTQIKGIVLKYKLFSPVYFNEMIENEIFVEQYFPVISQRMLNFNPPKTDTRPDGIIFEIDGKEFFKEIKFKLK